MVLNGGGDCVEGALAGGVIPAAFVGLDGGAVEVVHPADAGLGLPVLRPAPPTTTGTPICWPSAGYGISPRK